MYLVAVHNDNLLTDVNETTKYLIYIYILNIQICVTKKALKCLER